MLDHKANQRPNARNTITVKLNKYTSIVLLYNETGDYTLVDQETFKQHNTSTFWIKVVRK
jgi:hypothetical protein